MRLVFGLTNEGLITESGKQISLINGLIIKNKQIGYSVVEVGSGKYHFVSSSKL